MHQFEDFSGVLEDELNSELAWAQERKGSMGFQKRQLRASDNQQDPAWDDLCEKVNSGGPFWKALTKFEVENAIEYSWRYPGQAWQLNQSAVEHKQCSNMQYLHTLIKNCGLIFTEEVKPPRWLSATESLLGLHIIERHCTQVPLQQQ